ncbi:MAG: hypothetical protein ACHQZR_03565 [Candidatus Limnocylindrales bacterium]
MTRARLVPLAIAIYAIAAAFSALLGLQNGRPFGLVAVALAAVAVAVRDRPLWLAVVLILGGTILRLTFYGVLEADGLAVSQAALRTVLEGGNPYGHGYDVSIPPGQPFVYGPLALLTSLPGAWVELAAGVGTMALMAYLRSWVALAIYAAFPLATTMTMSGTNDVLPGLLIASGLLALRWKPWVGGVLLALAAGVKPYGFAWFPAAIGLGGLEALIGLALFTAIAWAPLLWWGIGAFLQSVELAREAHPVPEDALNLPELRVLAVVPFVASFFSRSWLAGVLLGTAVFVLVLFLDRWASVSYWLALAPILLIAGEETADRMLATRRQRMAPASGG